MGGFRRVLAFLVVVTLSACGGGGGGGIGAGGGGGSIGGGSNGNSSSDSSGGGSIMVVNGPPLPETFIFVDSADSFSVSNNTVLTPAPSNSTAAGGNASQITLAPDLSTGQPRFLTISIPLASGSYMHIFDLATAVPGAANGPLAAFNMVQDGHPLSDGNFPNTLIFDPTLNFSTYGIWISENTDTTSGAAGAIAFGNMTPAASINPSLGVANYSGKTIGAATSTGSSLLLVGDVSLTADFTKMSVQGTLNVNDTTGKPWSTLTMAPTPIAAAMGGAYNGTLTGTLPDNNPVAASDVHGHFYGPTANETAGTWSAANSTWQGFGAFGAAKH